MSLLSTGFPIFFCGIWPWIVSVEEGGGTDDMHDIGCVCREDNNKLKDGPGTHDQRIAMQTAEKLALDPIPLVGEREGNPQQRSNQ
jgi:hypothetical protein